MPLFGQRKAALFAQPRELLFLVTIRLLEMLRPALVRRIALLGLPVSMLYAATVQPLRAQSGEGAPRLMRA